MTHLLSLTKLEKLWLDHTAVTDEIVPLLAKLESLRELHVDKTSLTPEGIRRLGKLLPACRIINEWR